MPINIIYLLNIHRCKKKNKYYEVISQSDTTAEDEDQLSESDHTELRMKFNKLFVSIQPVKAH